MIESAQMMVPEITMMDEEEEAANEDAEAADFMFESLIKKPAPKALPAAVQEEPAKTAAPQP